MKAKWVNKTMNYSIVRVGIYKEFLELYIIHEPYYFLFFWYMPLLLD